MSRFFHLVALATVCLFLRAELGMESTCRAQNDGDDGRSRSISAYSSARSQSPGARRSVTVNVPSSSFRTQILAMYDANGNGRLDGKERLKARGAISKYRAQKGKQVYAQQRYRQAVRTAQTAYVQTMLRQRPTSFTLAPSYAPHIDCEDVEFSRLNVSSPAMRRVKGPPPSSAPGLIHVPASKIKCCVPSG